MAIVYVCKSSRKIVIEARTEASSRRAFIGYIFLSTNNHPHLETNDFFTLLLFLLLFLFLFLLIPHLFVSIFDVKTLLFSALKRLISNPQTLKLILPHEYTPRRRNRDREWDAFENGETSRYLSSLHYTRQSFSTVS